TAVGLQARHDERRLRKIHLPRDALHVRGGQLLSVGHDGELIPGVFFLREHIDNEKPPVSHRASPPEQAARQPGPRIRYCTPKNRVRPRSAGAEFSGLCDDVPLSGWSHDPFLMPKRGRGYRESAGSTTRRPTGTAPPRYGPPGGRP